MSRDRFGLIVAAPFAFVIAAVLIGTPELCRWIVRYCQTYRAALRECWREAA